MLGFKLLFAAGKSFNLYFFFALFASPEFINMNCYQILKSLIVLLFLYRALVGRIFEIILFCLSVTKPHISILAHYDYAWVQIAETMALLGERAFWNDTSVVREAVHWCNDKVMFIKYVLLYHAHKLIMLHIISLPTWLPQYLWRIQSFHLYTSAEQYQIRNSPS